MSIAITAALVPLLALLRSPASIGAFISLMVSACVGLTLYEIFKERLDYLKTYISWLISIFSIALIVQFLVYAANEYLMDLHNALFFWSESKLGGIHFGQRFSGLHQEPGAHAAVVGASVLRAPMLAASTGQCF